ncbi:MAG: MOSC domain-containing protein [Dermatophilaceae bacterium]
MPDHAPHVLSINVGKGAASPHTSAPTTGIDKRPVAAIEVRDPGPKHGGLGSGVVGDHVGDQRHHGGARQAVYAYAREDLDWWATQLGRPLRDGAFGENLTTSRVDTTTALIGEVWRVGTAVLRVEVPRIPCRTFAGYLGEPQWIRRFSEVGRTGAYLSVTVAGRIETGDEIAIERPDHDITLLLNFRAAMGDVEAARRVLAAGVLHETEHTWLADRVVPRA